MIRKRYHVLIMGAGIAGLTAAIALHRTGHVVRVFERQSELQATGAGLILWSNATLALRALELEPAISDIGYPLKRLSILDPAGTRLAVMDAERASARADAPTLSVHRSELMCELYQYLPADAIAFGREFSSFEMRSGEVVAAFSDGGEEIGDILLGADGLNSAVRAQIHGEQPPRYSGYTAWRGVVDWELRSVEEMDRSTETWGPGRRFGWVPMSGNRVYWFATKNAPERQAPDDRGHKAELTKLFGDWHSPIPETVAATESAAILRHDIYDRPPIPRWGVGPVTLAGDAAHPMTPNLGQGAAMGIEDAAVLASCLSTYVTIDGALRAYEHQRRSRTAELTRLSYQLGRIAQMERSRMIGIRDRLARSIPNALSQRQVMQITDWNPPTLEPSKQ